MISSASATSSEPSLEVDINTVRRSRRKPGLSSSSMPFAYPRYNYATNYEAEMLRKAAQEDRAASVARNGWEVEQAEKILFYKSRGMSDATLITKFGREIVQRVLESARKRDEPVSNVPAGNVPVPGIDPAEEFGFL